MSNSLGFCKEVQSKFDHIDDMVPVDQPFNGFGPRFVDGICRVLGGDEVE